jgi:Phage integrase central domain/Arm DNA-binding domain
MGLGGLAKVSLATARDMAAEARKTLALGLDPIAEKRRRQSEREQEHSRAKTFGEFADEYITEHEKGWRNAKHRQQWRNTLTTHAAPLRAKTLDAITTEDVLRVWRPIWTDKAETAARLRGRIEQILDAAKARNLSQA